MSGLSPLALTRNKETSSSIGEFIRFDLPDCGLQISWNSVFDPSKEILLKGFFTDFLEMPHQTRNNTYLSLWFYVNVFKENVNYFSRYLFPSLYFLIALIYAK